MDSLAYSNPRSRRSHPSLTDLHITPLTRDPLASSPFIDDDNDTPDTQRRSYLSSRSLPQTPSILSRSPSRTRTRSRSRGHRRNAKSMLTLTSLEDVQQDATSGAAAAGETAEDGSGHYHNTPHTPGGSRRPKSAMASGRQTPGRVRVVDRDRTDFLLRTASLLVESASESKGQGWISKRNSSTSLAAMAGGGPGNNGSSALDTATWEDLRAEREGGSHWAAAALEDEFGSSSWSRVEPVLGNSRKGSRRGSFSAASSRFASRRGSRATLGIKTPGGASTPRDGYFDGMSLDFADEADWDEDSDDDDEEIDEGELKRLLRRRVGGFFEDIFGGWLDFRGEEDDDEVADTEDEDPMASADLEGPGGKDEAARKKKKEEEAERRKLRFAGLKREDIVAVRPPSDAGGAWSDARWLVGLARRALI